MALCLACLLAVLATVGCRSSKPQVAATPGAPATPAYPRPAVDPRWTMPPAFADIPPPVQVAAPQPVPQPMPQDLGPAAVAQAPVGPPAFVPPAPVMAPEATAPFVVNQPEFVAPAPANSVPLAAVSTAVVGTNHNATVAPPANPPATIEKVAFDDVPATPPDGQPGSRPGFVERMRIPTDIPGAKIPNIPMPPRDQDQKQISTFVDKLFPHSPPLQALLPPLTRTAEGVISLSDIEQLAIANNPALAQAASGVTVAQGVAIQAGLSPNPIVGYEADTVGSSANADYHGIYASQLVKTGGKLRLARSAANVDIMNQGQMLRRTQVEVLAAVKTQYFNVLVSQEALRAYGGLVELTEESYRIQAERLKGGEGAAYESSQLHGLAVQARLALVQAQNRYISAWKQLAASAGVPDLPPTFLDGQADSSPPLLDFDVARTRMLNNHPDMIAAQNTVSKARLQLQQARVTPVPDVLLYATFQRDYTLPGRPNLAYNMQVGVPMPVFDRNQGGIIAAQANLRIAELEIRDVNNTLTKRLADAFERYNSARAAAQYYREQVMPDLVVAYRGTYERHQQQPAEVGFADVVVAQQNLAAGIANYYNALAGQWSAAADLANVLMLQDLEELYALQPPELPAPDQNR